MTNFGIHHYQSFLAAVVVFQLIPGPGTLAILSATARGGVREGMGTVLGTLAGDFTFMLAAVLGLAALLAASPASLAALQVAGILYLVWIGIGLLRARDEGAAPAAAAASSAWRCAARGYAVSLTNPKVAVFFMAFFPLFIGKGAGAPTLAALMLHVTAISLAYQTVLVLAGAAVARRLARFQGARALAKRLAGVALIGFGVRLALDLR